MVPIIRRPDEPLEILQLPAPENWRQEVIQIMPGWWWLYSLRIKEWRAEGKGLVGGTSMCKEAKQVFEEKKKKYGKPPIDLIYRFEYNDGSKKALKKIANEIIKGK